MNHRNVSIVGLAAVATVLAGCAAQYRNPAACVSEMRSRLDGTSKGELKITNRAVSYRGSRVVIEGQLRQGAAVGGASAPAAGSAASTPMAVSVAASGHSAAPSAASAPVAASAPMATSAPVTATAPAEPAPTTPVGRLVARFSHRGPNNLAPVVTATAAECTFDASGLKSFRWLAPADLAKTTPMPAPPPGN